MPFFSLPAELRWSIMCYLRGKHYRVLHDNFDECKGLDSTLGYYKNYYADYLFIPNEKAILFHLKDGIRFLPFDQIDPIKGKNLWDYIVTHCPYLIKTVDNTLFIRSDDLDIEYLESLCLTDSELITEFEKMYCDSDEEAESFGAYVHRHRKRMKEMHGILRGSLLKLLPTLEDEMVVPFPNYDIIRMLNIERQINEDLCKKILEVYGQMSMQDFKSFYSIGDIFYTIICSIAFRHNYEKYEELLEYLLNCSPQHVKSLSNKESEIYDFIQSEFHTYRDYRYGHYFTIKEQPYFNSVLNTFIPLSNIPEIDSDAVYAYLEQEWFITATVPLSEIEVGGFTPYVSGGSLLQALTCPNAKVGWETSDWDIFMIPNSDTFGEIRSDKLLDLFQFIKRDCNDKYLQCGETIIELFDNSGDIDEEEFRRIPNKYRRDIFFDKVFSNFLTKNLQVISLGNTYFGLGRGSWSARKKIETILRNYDTAATQIYWDGKEVYLSAMALYCVKNMVNLCRSNIRPSRLEKYTKRGFEPRLLDFGDHDDLSFYTGHTPEPNISDIDNSAVYRDHSIKRLNKHIWKLKSFYKAKVIV